ncbi:MAG: glycoside hydrolase family 3 C-terminal domain-containing protein [Actinomycetota bacterium]|nr:glycoside hydrolase family 3 C-terminal domain-containing protein [Actinomycetota bacterium]
MSAHLTRRGLLVAGVGAAAVPLTVGSPGSAISSADSRARALVRQLTLDEKIALVHGGPSDVDVGFVPGLPRLGIPDLRLTDGPAGVRQPKTTDGPSTAFPAPIALASTFDDGLARRLGSALGSEAKAKGQNVLFAPIVNLARVPEGGRLFEGFGEDPMLTGAIGREVVLGIQSMGVVATVKHWLANDQEDSRHQVSVDLDERTLREVYLASFVEAVLGGRASAVMAANNGVAGAYNGQSAALLHDLLKVELGFLGFVCSDYSATHDTVLAALAGLDLDLPDDQWFGAPLRRAVVDGTVPVAVLDDKVERLLRTVIALGILDGGGTSARGGPGEVNTRAHADLAQEVAERGAVLLRNEQVGGLPLLPLSPQVIRSIAVVGPYAANPRIGGDGSSHISPLTSVSPVDGIAAHFPGATVRSAPGAVAEATPVPSTVMLPPGGGPTHGLLGAYFANETHSGTPVFTRVDGLIGRIWGKDGPGHGIPAEGFSVRWTGTLTARTTGTHTFSTRSDDDSWVWVGGALVVDNGGEHGLRVSSGQVQLVAGRRYTLRVDYVQRTFRAGLSFSWLEPVDTLVRAAARLAASCEVAVVVVGDVETEGSDRESLALPGQQDQLIAAVAAVNPRTVVVSQSGGPVLMPWLASVPAVLQLWYGGQQVGDALARLLAGEVSPAGRLPVTFCRQASDYPARTPSQYPGVAATGSHQQGLDLEEHYDEGLLVGYRYLDAQHTEPMFPFGHGLAYTTFAYGPVSVTVSGSAPDPALSVRVSVPVTNSGNRTGEEVVQVYVARVRDLGAPPKVLRAYRRRAIPPGTRQVVRITLGRKDFARWDVASHAWVVPPGPYDVIVGASSRDIRGTARITLSS